MWKDGRILVWFACDRNFRMLMLEVMDLFVGGLLRMVCMVLLVENG